MINAERLATIAAEFGADDLRSVDMMLIVNRDELTQIWPRP